MHDNYSNERPYNPENIKAKANLYGVKAVSINGDHGVTNSDSQVGNALAQLEENLAVYEKYLYTLFERIGSITEPFPPTDSNGKEEISLVPLAARIRSASRQLAQRNEELSDLIRSIRL